MDHSPSNVHKTYFVIIDNPAINEVQNQTVDLWASGPVLYH